MADVAQLFARPRSSPERALSRLSVAELIVHLASKPSQVRNAYGLVGADIATTAAMTFAKILTPKLLRFLIDHGAAVKFPSVRGKYLVHALAEHGNVRVLRFMLHERMVSASAVTVVDRMTPMHFAAKHDRCAALCVLKRFGADVNARTTTDRTPIFEAMQNGAFAAVRWLVANGALTAISDTDGFTPAMLAIMYAFPLIAMYLVANGVDPNTKHRVSGDTLLHLVARFCPNDDTARRLVLLGADPRIKNAKNETPYIRFEPEFSLPPRVPPESVRVCADFLDECEDELTDLETESDGDGHSSTPRDASEFLVDDSDDE